jgi:hypothetical protein
LEKAFLARLEKHFNKNKILCDNQHGFKKGKSTVRALFDLVAEECTTAWRTRRKLI